VPPLGPDDYIEFARAFLPKKVASALLDLALPTVALETRPILDAHPSDTRLGGRPKVEPDFAWPCVDSRPAALLAAVDLAAIGFSDPEQEAIDLGCLNIFYDVTAPELPGSNGRAAPALVHLSSKGIYEDRPTPANTPQYASIVIDPVLQLSVPHPDEPIVAELAERYGPKMVKAHDALIEHLGAPRHRMLGWPDLVAGPMQDALPELDAETDGDWQLLAQLDSDDALDWSWGNVGKLYVWVPEFDLADGRFDRCQVVVQSY